MRTFLFAALLLSSGASCIMAEGSLRLSLEGIDPTLADSIQRIDVWAFDGQTADGAEVLCADLESGALEPTSDSLSIRYTDTFLFRQELPESMGHFGQGRVVFYAVARDGQCSVVASGCADARLSSGQDRTVTVPFNALASSVQCPDTMACVEGFCRPCEADGECDDEDRCTANVCGGGTCSFPATDLDEDDDDSPSPLCGGDDCDDSNSQAYPGAPRLCGAGLDHDCDGVVDDSQGCGTCAGATGFSRVGRIDTPATGLFVVGPGAETSSHQVFVSTASSVDLYDWDGSSGTFVGSTATTMSPHPPKVVGDWLLVADERQLGQWSFARSDLRQGSADALSNVGVEMGSVVTFVAGMSRGYISGADSLFSFDLTGLPDLTEPVVQLEGDRWLMSLSLIHSPGYVIGVALRNLSWAELDGDGDVVDGGFKAFVDGTAVDAALTADEDWILIADQDRALVMVNKDEALGEPGSTCCESWVEHRIPMGCVNEDCHLGYAVAAAGRGRAVVLTVVNGTTPSMALHLMDISSPESITIVQSYSVSDAPAFATDVVVSGGTVFAANSNEHASAGLVEVFELTCPERT